MSELNAKEFFVLAEQTPGEVTFSNFEELKEYLRNGLSVYETTEYTADNLDEAIYDHNQLKVIMKKLTDKKKEIEKAYTMPFVDVKRMLDELIDMVKEPLNRADMTIKECERKKKRNDIISFSKKAVVVLGPDAVNVLKSPSFYNSRWLNSTYKMRDIEYEIKNKVTEVQGNIQLIKNLGGENAPILLARFFETLSTAGMSEFLQSVKKEEEKATSADLVEMPIDTIENNFEKKILPTKVELKTEKIEIVSKIIKLTGSEKDIKSALLQLQMNGISVEELYFEESEFRDKQSKNIDSSFRQVKGSDYHNLADENAAFKIKIGDSVKICNLNTGVIETYSIADCDNQDMHLKNVINSESSLAKALLDKVIGYVFLWINDDGERDEYKIIDVMPVT